MKPCAHCTQGFLPVFFRYTVCLISFDRYLMNFSPAIPFCSYAVFIHSLRGDAQLLGEQ